MTLSAPPYEDVFAPAMDRATGARPIGGNQLQHHPDSARALDAMLDLIARAEQWIHFENYIIRDDRTGRRFAEALAARARAGVRVRVVYDALGSVGTSRRYWRGLREAGAEVRAFHPLLSRHVLDTFLRDHRKLLVTDGARAILGGLCIGDEWAGDPARQRLPWRDTMVAVCGPAAAAADRAFARVWERAGTGEPLPSDELEADPAECGSSTVRVVAGAPGRARVYRAVQLLAASARERLWITDAYLIAPPPLYAALLDAARSGVDVRLLVPGTSDLPVLRDFTRGGYRELLRAGARIFEWQGPMLHATFAASAHDRAPPLARDRQCAAAPRVSAQALGLRARRRHPRGAAPRRRRRAANARRHRGAWLSHARRAAAGVPPRDEYPPGRWGDRRGGGVVRVRRGAAPLAEAGGGGAGGGR